MKAVILAGGFGTRLRPLTCTVPKPMATLLGRPVLSYILELLKAHGATDVTLTTAYMPEVIAQYIEAYPKQGLHLRCVEETQPLGTAGSVKAALGDEKEPILIVSGDGICDFDLTEILAFHREKGAAVTIVTTEVQDPREYGLVHTDADGAVIGFCEKPDWNGVSTSCANTGIYVLDPEVLDDIPEKQSFDFSKDLFPLLLRKKLPIFGYLAAGYWCDIGDLTAYRTCQADMLAGEVHFSRRAVAGGVYAEEALPEGEYQLVPPVYIGRDVTIGAGAVIGPNTVIGSGSYIGKGAKVCESILLQNTAVYDKAVVNQAVICENAVLKYGAQVFEESAVGADCVIGSHACVGPQACIWPKKYIANGTHVSGNLKYGVSRTELFSDYGICGLAGVELDPVRLSLLGRSIASSAIGKKIGIAADSASTGHAAYHILAGSLAVQGSSVWNFGECLLPQLYFYTAFCSLQSGIYISEHGGKLRLQVFCAGGLPLPRSVQREIEARFHGGDFCRISPDGAKEISDMESLEAVYLRELTREAGASLKGQSVHVRCPNEKINMLLEDCLYRLETQNGDEITLKLNYDGTQVSAFHRECGWIPHDKLLAICCQADFESGRDVAVAFDAPYALTVMAAAHGRRTVRYLRTPADDSDRDARLLALEQLYVRDALFLSIRLLGVLQRSGKSLPALLHTVPQFFVRRRTVPIRFSPTELMTVLHAPNAVPQKEGVLLETENGRVLLIPQKSGKKLRIFAESASYETACELCGDIEEKLAGH